MASKLGLRALRPIIRHKSVALDDLLLNPSTVVNGSKSPKSIKRRGVVTYFKIELEKNLKTVLESSQKIREGI